MFDIPTSNIGIADLENQNTAVGIGTLDAPIKRRRGRPKGSAAVKPEGGASASVSTNGSSEPRASSAAATAGELYFDIETVPDYSRLELFGLEPLPEPAPITSREQCPPCADLLAESISNLKASLARLNPADEYLDFLAEAEKTGKGRAGVMEAIGDAKKAKNAHADAIEKRRKLLSVTPEYCRVACLGWAVRGEEPQAMLAVDPADERALLEKFWELIRERKPIVGYNVAAFDLPVIYVRSIILRVPSSRIIDPTPWKSDVLDLMTTRFGRMPAMKLKSLAMLYGIHVPAGDVDGSQVEELLSTEPEKVVEYCKSDVAITRELRSLFGGYFCG